MKKNLRQLAGVLLIALALSPFASFAVIHNISVADFTFTPSVLINVHVGDTVRWQWINGSHTTTSVSIPGGAPTWDVALNSTVQVFDYPVTVAGNYTYKCTPHAPGMVGSFSAGPATAVAVVEEPHVNLYVYPNPVKNDINLSFSLVSGGEGMVKVYNLLGKLTKEFLLEGRGGKNTVTIPADELPKGIYLAELFINSRQLGIQRIIKN